MDEYTGSPTVNRRGLTRSDGLGLPPVDSSSSIGVESPSSSSFNGDSPARPHHSFRRCEPTLLASTFSTAYMGASASKANLASADLDDTDVAAITGDVPGYQDFVAQYPNALNVATQLIEKLKGKQLAVFLDYDGTLTPIVTDPEAAVLTDECRAELRALADLAPTAIVSGRRIERVVSFIQLQQLFYAGSHGLDIQGPLAGNYKLENPEQCSYQPAAAYFSTMNTLNDELREQMKSIPGSSVEHNKYCVSVHYRNCDPAHLEQVDATVTQAVAQHGGAGVRITHGKKVLELRPDVPWNKGKAVQFLLENLQKRWAPGEAPEIVPIYIGDDLTDEDAFQVLQETGQGFGVLVTRKKRDFTHALYTLRDPAEVIVFLRRLTAYLGAR